MRSRLIYQEKLLEITMMKSVFLKPYAIQADKPANKTASINGDRPSAVRWRNNFTN